MPQFHHALNNTVDFPIGIPTTWMSPEQLLIPDPHLKNWLLDTGSLTERLQAHCRRFSLSLLGQQPARPDDEEQRRLLENSATTSDNVWQVREVVLHGDERPWVFARSILPENLCAQDFAELGETPLGQIIFNDPRFVRSPFQLTQMTQSRHLLESLGISVDMPLWGRRSVFSFQRYHMMVAEVFLPGAPAYKQLPNI